MKASVPVFTMNFDNQAINEDLLEIIEVYLASNTGAKNLDKQKTRTLVCQLFSTFLDFQPRQGGIQFKLQSENLFEKVDAIERQLYIHNFSYAECVREKLESKSGEKEGKNKEVDEKEKEIDEEGEGDNEEEAKDTSVVKVEQNGEEADGGKDDEEIGDADAEDTKAENGDDRDSFDKIIDQKSDDSSKDQHTRPMEFLPYTAERLERASVGDTFDVYPKFSNFRKLFYGGHQFYVCFRFYYTLFERLLKASELARDLPINKVTAQMTSEEKEKLMADRYDMFKEIFKLYLSENIEAAVYEDCLRCIYGRDAGFLFCLDKIVANLTRSLPSDDLSLFVMENSKDLFSANIETTIVSENVKYSQVSYKLRYH